ncbi:oxidoreductase [Paraliobacillus quinghaiensis]|uniref:Oxidoreductase n=1 Tax=Paraliobacillus quinghaiensis TaxID=470815 RepID=A0A917THB2_9BACI|nr:SDR family oxidoreductase [Paraliobacillus quinghaiensis]GGM22308.1 oxidoreductase [Paraliobacillus quinghaiensis]
MRDFNGKTIIITGASSGIGEGLSHKLAACGANLILLARSGDKLKKLQTILEKEHTINCKYYTVDLSDRKAWKETLIKIEEEHPTIDAIINNAGFGVFDTVQEADYQDIEKMFQVNVLALMEGVQSLLPHFVSKKQGHIINVASFAGKIATPKSSAYSASKHAVIGFSNALRLEVENKGIFVTTVNLGPVRTNFFQVADPSGNYQKSVDQFMLEPEVVVDQIIKALFRRKREINLPRWMELGSRFYHLFPWLSERLLRKQFNKK